MAALFIDVDGTLVQYHTNEWLPGVVETLTRLAGQGHQICFITMRDQTRDAGAEWSIDKTLALFAELPFTPYCVLTNIQSPRVLIDDSAVNAIHAETNNANSWCDQLA